MILNCAYCDQSFEWKRKFLSIKPRKYCSSICMGKSLSINNTLPKRFGICSSCNKEFEWKRTQGSKGKVCSVACIKGNSNVLIEYRKKNPAVSFWKTSTWEEKLIRYKSFLDKRVIRQDGCWGWKSFISGNGYGVIGPSGHAINAHRASYLVNVGVITGDLWVLHTCDNKICTNPDHLYLGTCQDNVNDIISRNRGNYNKQNSKNAKLNPDKARDIKQMLKDGFSQASIAIKYNVRPGTIQNIADGRTWKDC